MSKQAAKFLTHSLVLKVTKLQERLDKLPFKLSSRYVP